MKLSVLGALATLQTNLDQLSASGQVERERSSILLKEMQQAVELLQEVFSVGPIALALEQLSGAAGDVGHDEVSDERYCSQSGRYIGHVVESEGSNFWPLIDTPVLDLAGVFRRADSNHVLYGNLLHQFFFEQRHKISYWRELVESNSLGEIAVECGQLKAMAANLAMIALARAAARCETLANFKHGRGVLAALELLGHEFDRAESETQRLLASGLLAAPHGIIEEGSAAPLAIEERKARILVVDSAEANVKILSGVLCDSYEVEVASSAAEAIAKVSSFEPDLVLLEASLHDRSGYEVLEELRQTPNSRDVPIIVLASRGDDDGETKGLALGAADYIAKPVRPAILRARVENLIEAKLNRDLLTKLSRTDGLTGIHNRRAFDDILLQEWRRATRDRTMLAVIICDIDYFKQYNDSCGHPAGDECLRVVSGLLRSSLRRGGDILARYGGEEFACILPDTPLAGAVRVAQFMREAVLAAKVPHPKSAVSEFVTVSFGVASLLPSKEGSKESLVAVADSMLYLAKKMGRNQIQS